MCVEGCARMVATSVMAFVVLLHHTGEGEAKTVSDHKINFGWPNFFNPELGVMREKGGRNREEEEGGTAAEGEDNAVDTTSQEEEEEYEGLIDYTLKGGLRGTLLLLNSTDIPQVGNLTSSEMKNLTQAAKMAMAEEDNKEGEEEEEEGEKREKGGILTEEGVRLRTPIVLRKHPAELGKYGAKITFYAEKEAPTKFIYYGNWCGRGGRSAPVDRLDRCCLDHDKCYGRSIRQCPDVWRKPYSRMYAWTLLEGEVVCVRSESTCVNHICECDREAASCFHTFLHKVSSAATTHLGTKTL